MELEIHYTSNFSWENNLYCGFWWEHGTSLIFMEDVNGKLIYKWNVYLMEKSATKHLCTYIHIIYIIFITYIYAYICTYDLWGIFNCTVWLLKGNSSWAPCPKGWSWLCQVFWWDLPDMRLGIKPIGWEIYHKWRDLDGFGAFKVCFSKEILGSKQPLGGQHQDPDTLGDLASSIGI